MEQDPRQPASTPPAGPGPNMPAAAEGPPLPPAGTGPAAPPAPPAAMPPPLPEAGGASARSGPRAGFWRRFAAALLDGVLLGALYGVMSAIIDGGTAQALNTIFSLSYFTFFEGSASGQTVGKRALGIRVIDFDGGGSIGHVRAFIRWVGRILSAIPLLLGYLWMLWDGQNQTWHDKLANAVVVPQDAYPVSNWPG